MMKFLKKLCDEIYCCILFKKMHDRPFDNGRGVFKLQIVFMCGTVNSRRVYVCLMLFFVYCLFLHK